MNFKKLDTLLASEILYSEFQIDNCTHFCFSIAPKIESDFLNQFDLIIKSIQEIYSTFSIKKEHTRFSRIFVSDITNQIQEITNSSLFTNYIYSQCTSIIEQAPADYKNIGIIITCKKNDSCKITIHDTSIEFFENNYNHIWHCNIQSHIKESVFNQTLHSLEYYQSKLRKQNATIQNNCLRTWFFIHDIDNTYKQMVEARKEYFTCIGLTPKTHFIASTGIEGKNPSLHSKISLDAYAISNIFPEQIEYIQAKDFLNPTHEYGVTFERGTAIYYENYIHILISGTASIDNTGEIVHENSIEKQTERTFINISALLQEVNSTFNDVQYIIVYLRNINDYNFVNNYILSKYPNIPYIIVKGSVCRPGWLIEIECEAYKIIE